MENLDSEKEDDDMKTHNLFISHSWNYSNQYINLINLLKKRTYFDFRDYSVPKDDPVHDADSDKELKAAIKNQMSPCGVIIILAGVYASCSKWIDIEINLAKNGFIYSKPILAVKPLGSQKISTVVREAADKLVGWNTESIVNGIRELN